MPKDVEKIRDELADKSHKENGSDDEYYAGYIIGFNACWEILAPEIDKLVAALEFYAHESKSEDDAFIRDNKVVSFGRRALETLTEIKKYTE